MKPRLQRELKRMKDDKIIAMAKRCIDYHRRGEVALRNQLSKDIAEIICCGYHESGTPMYRTPAGRKTFKRFAAIEKWAAAGDNARE